jgi:hypothetical protein
MVKLNNLIWDYFLDEIFWDMEGLVLNMNGMLYKPKVIKLRLKYNLK